MQVPELDQAGQVHGVQVPRGQVLLHDLRAQGLQQHGGRGRGHQPLRGHLRHGRGLRRHHRQHRPRRRGVRHRWRIENIVFHLNSVASRNTVSLPSQSLPSLWSFLMRLSRPPRQ